MSAEAKTETDRTPKGILLSVAKAIQFAEDYLSKAGEVTYDHDQEIVKQITVSRQSLKAFLTQLTQAQAITDEALFAKATGALKLQTPSLQTVSDQVKSIASNGVTSPWVSGAMEQTVTFIQQAVLFMAELP